MTDGRDASPDFGDGLFEEPASFRPRTPPATTRPFLRRDGTSLDVRLVGAHPLWGHVLYPASTSLARFLEVHRESLVRGRTVVELGAAGGLPSLVAALEGASAVVATDFPDPALLENLRANRDLNIPSSPLRSALSVEGFTWGSSPDLLLDKLPAGERRFDVVLMSDLVFNHSQHDALLRSCESCLCAVPASLPLDSSSSLNSLPPQDLVPPLALAFFSHHRPQLVDQDLAFLHSAVRRGWTVWKVVEDRHAGVAFADDDEREGYADAASVGVRGTVWGWAMRPPLQRV